MEARKTKDEDADFHSSQGGHPLRKLKGQSFEDFEKEYMTKYEKPCVKIIDKRVK